MYEINRQQPGCLVRLGARPEPRRQIRATVEIGYDCIGMTREQICLYAA